ncbi:MAG TPA: hypothetical protein VGD38_08215 [Pyrinomonadaceae bacterium]
MTRIVKLLVIVSVLCVGPAAAQQIDKNARYLFYISGYIVAEGNTRPASPKFGVYADQGVDRTRNRVGPHQPLDLSHFPKLTYA